VNKMQQQVVTFHRGMGQPVGHRARPLPQDRIPVRVELIREEFIDELLPALGVILTDDGEIKLTGAEQDVVEVADAAIDILYVTFGLLVEMGVDAEALFDEVQRSNMSKFGADGKPIIAGPNDPDGVFEGRVKKGPNYFKPRLRELLELGRADLDVSKVQVA
jgi:predicted HAD superfamily Cof-like phosphohydrolase